MLLRNIFILLILSLNLNVSSHYGTITPQETKGTSSILQNKFKHLSVLPGLVWVSTGILENIAELYVDNKNPNVELINELFFRLGEEFLPARSMINDAYYFTPHFMGQIAAELYELKQKLTDEELQNLKKFLNHHNKFGADKKIKIAAEKLSTIIKAQTKKSSAKTYPLLFLRALVASDQKISVFKVIGAFVYMKCEDKLALHDYYRGLAETLGLSYNLNMIFTDPGFLKSKLEWAQNRFHEEEIIENLDSDYEKMVFSLLQPKNNWVEPYLTSFATAYVSQGAERFGFPDCGENSLLNAYRVLFAKKDTKEIDIELLEKIKTPAAVLNFFRTRIISGEKILNFIKLEDLRSSEARNAWAELASNKENLYRVEGAYVDRDIYYGIRRPKDLHCEINFGFINLDRFIDEIQGVTFDELVSQVNQYTDNNFLVEKAIDSRGVGSITIKTKDRGDYKWNFNEGHFYLELSPEEAFKNIQEWINKADPERDLLARLSITKEKIESMVNHKDYSYLLLLNKLKNDDAIENFIKNTRAHIEVRLENLIQRIQTEDSHKRILFTVIKEKEDADVISYLNALVANNRSGIVRLFPYYPTFVDLVFSRKAVNPAIFKASIKIMNDQDIAHALYLAADKNLPDVLKVLVPQASNEILLQRYDHNRQDLVEIAVVGDNHEALDVLLTQIKNDDIIANALFVAVDRGKYQALKQLLAAASDEALCKLGDKNLLSLALRKVYFAGYQNILELLLAKIKDDVVLVEAVYEAIQRSDHVMFETLLPKLSNKALGLGYGPKQETILEVVVNYGDLKKLDVLLGKIIDQTILGKGLYAAVKWGKKEAVYRLLPQVADETLKLEYGQFQLNVLAEAVYRENLDLIDFLLERIKDETIIGRAFYEAVSRENEKLIEHLLTKISDEALKLEYGKPPRNVLAMAVCQDNETILNILLKQNKDQTVIGKALFEAIISENVKFVVRLLEQISDEALSLKYGRHKKNVLEAAIEQENDSILKVLLLRINDQTIIEKALTDALKDEDNNQKLIDILRTKMSELKGIANSF